MFAVIYSLLSLLAVNQAQNQNTDLILHSDEILQINTTAPEAYHTTNGTTVTYNISLREGVVTDVGNQDWHYQYAELVFHKDVVFKPGSVVEVIGRYGLSIKSLTGDISVGTDINMTCAVDATGMGMCLGGYAPNRKNQFDSTFSHLAGTGPGGLVITNNQGLYLPSDALLEAAGHGGHGSGCTLLPINGFCGLTYEQLNISNLIGGSAGTSKTSIFSPDVSRPGSGGGAIELQADKGTITIASCVSASAQRLPGSLEVYSGSSGGTIRLKAKRVEICSGGRLEVDGAPAGTRGNMTKFEVTEANCLFGGAGGVVQIIATSGKIEPGTISLKPGENYPCRGSSSGPGFLLIRDGSEQMYNTWNYTGSFPNDTFSWPWGSIHNSVDYCGQLNNTWNSSWSFVNATLSIFPALFPTNIPFACETSRTGEEDVDTKLRNIESWASCLKHKFGTISFLDFMDSVSRMMKDFCDVVTLHSLTRSQVDQSVDVLIEVKDIYLDLTFLNEITTADNWDLFENVSLIVDKILNPLDKQTWNDSKLIAMLHLMDEVSVKAASGKLRSISRIESKRSYIGTNMAVQIVKHVQEHFTDLTLSMNTKEQRTANQDSVILSREAIATHLTDTGDVTVVTKVYKDVEDIFPNHLDRSMRFDDQIFHGMSPLISVTILINDKSIKILSAPLRIVFALQNALTGDRRAHCVYWDKSLNSWKNDGLKLVAFNDTHVQCSTNHLTSFAVLFSKTKVPDDHRFALHLLTYICCGLSIVALFITLIIFYSIEALSSDRHRIHMHLALSILLSQLLFLTGIDATKHKILCSIVAGFLHYLFLVSFSWMCVEGIHLYMKIIRVYKSESMRLLYYYIFCWGFPVIYVGVAATINSSGYGTESACWLLLKNGFIWVFIGPVIIIVLINLVVLVMVIKVVVTSADMMKSRRAKIMSGVKGMLVLLPLLGITWVFGLLIVHDFSIVFTYIFTVANTLQGFFIFIFHCVGNSEVRAALRRFREKNFDFNSIFSPSNADSVTSVQRRNKKDRRLKVSEKVEKTKVYPLKNTTSHTREIIR